jgi:hypothetical protein
MGQAQSGLLDCYALKRTLNRPVAATLIERAGVQ